jgi:hypothetical protein
VGVALNWWQRFLLRLARVEAEPVGTPRDGMKLLMGGSSGSELDRSWQDLQQEFADTRELWRRNPLCRRAVAVVTAYVVGEGISVGAKRAELADFLRRFWSHPENGMARRQYEMCDELTRAGELFVTLHLNRGDGMSYVRLLPAARVDRVETAPGDYETELAYHEVVGPDDPAYPDGRMWLAAGNPDAGVADESGRFPPICLHFAVNRPAGCVRGESDLAPALPWLRRYTRWLEDRLRLNAAVHAFLWVVRVPGALVEATQERLRTPPESGTVQVVDRDQEEWSAVAPDLHAGDAAADGRAVRWMVAAGSPGLALVDFGESDDANLATARAQGELRGRVLVARQAYFAQALATIAVTAYNRAVAVGLEHGPAAAVADVRVVCGDVQPGDNAELGQGAASVASALATAASSAGLAGESWRRLVLQTVTEYAGQGVSDADMARILAESAVAARAATATGGGAAK